ncbi:MAG: single-stranded DNA-binding protein [candidate division NC10 bacterium]|nr:single-stranded DNA-binding protein [candidate division NC10 bacterium]
MANFNRVIVMGNLTRDPELRYTPSGAAVTSFGLGINRRFRDSSGAPKEEVTFVEIVAWGKQAELCTEYLKKGRLVLIEGRLRQERWESREGESRSAVKVVAERIQFLPNGRPQAAEGDPEGEGTGASESDVPF